MNVFSANKIIAIIIYLMINRYIYPGVCVWGGGGGLLVNLVQKKNEKGYFFQAGQCAALSLFRVRKMSF